MREEKYMGEIKEIEVTLDCEAEKYLLKFSLSENKIVDLYDNNMDQLKELFTQIMNDLIKQDLHLHLVISEEAKTGGNQLACEMATAYINDLNDEIIALIESDNLKMIRNIELV